MRRFIDILTGTTGIVALETVNNVPMEGINEGLKLVIQIVIGVVTLINLVKDNKKKNPKPN